MSEVDEKKILRAISELHGEFVSVITELNRLSEQNEKILELLNRLELESDND